MELIDLKTNQTVVGSNLNRHMSTITSLAFSENGKNLISASLDGLVYKWQFSQKELIAIPFKEHNSWVWSVAINKKEDRFCSGGKDKKVILYVNKEDDLVEEITLTCKRNLTISEWNQYVGEDIPYQKTIAKF
jgi:WD40 repeat protein